MTVDPKSTAVEDAVKAISNAVAKSLAEALRPTLAIVFEAGQQANMAAILRAVHQAPTMPEVPPPAPLAVSAPGGDGRVARGSVRRAVVEVLLAHKGGLPLGAIKVAAKEIDPDISDGGISNELTRNTQSRYDNVGGIWRMKPAYYEKRLAIKAGEQASENGSGSGPGETS
jgi:hypothetical protein